MDELVEWYGQQLDTDERIARACPGDGKWTPADIAFYGNDLSPEVRAHMAEHDPARVLREIDAKRRTLERHTPHSSGTIGCSAHCSRPHPGAQVCNHDGYRWPCPDVRDLASVYDQRPGYKESWRP